MTTKLVKGAMGVVYRFAVDTSINDASFMQLMITRPGGTVVTIDTSSSALEIGASTTTVYDETVSATVTFTQHKYVQCALTSASGIPVLASGGWYRPRLWYYRSASGIALPSRSLDDNGDPIQFYVET